MTSIRTAALALGAAIFAAAPGVAESAETRVYQHDVAEVRLHLHEFLNSHDRQTLEVIAASPEVLATMLETGAGHAAIALAPADGLIRDGAPTESATAIGALPDAATARAEAQRLCNAARSGGPDCAVVLEVAPRR